MISNTIDHYAQIVWDFHLLHHKLRPADMIVCFGSNDLRIAEHCADLWFQKLAPKILFSGGVGRGTNALFNKSEAELFTEVVTSKGVPATAIIQEIESTNSGENVTLTRALIDKLQLSTNRLIMVQKPYMERRLYATIIKQWQGPEFIISSPAISYKDYPTAVISRELLINFMIGDLQRIIEYPALGYQIYQEVPLEVLKSFNKLVELGFNTCLIQK